MWRGGKKGKFKISKGSPIRNPHKGVDHYFTWSRSSPEKKNAMSAGGKVKAMGTGGDRSLESVILNQRNRWLRGKWRV